MKAGNQVPRRLTILGSTGSIGQNTLDVIGQLGGREAFEVERDRQRQCRAAGRTGKGVGAELAVTASDKQYHAEGRAFGNRHQGGAGRSGLTEAADIDTDWVMAAIVGTAGLAPTLAAARRGADIALANKECLVSAGDLFVKAVRRRRRPADPGR